MQKIKNIFIAAGLTLFTLTPVFAAGTTYAQVSEESKNAACQGIGAATGAGDCEAGAGSSVGDLVATIVRILSWIVGIISIVMMIVGGLKFVTSNGNAQAITSARNTVIYALVGVAVAVVAQVLVNFVVNQVSGVSAEVQACRDRLPQSEWGTCD